MVHQSPAHRLYQKDTSIFHGATTGNRWSTSNFTKHGDSSGGRTSEIGLPTRENMGTLGGIQQQSTFHRHGSLCHSRSSTTVGDIKKVSGRHLLGDLHPLFRVGSCRGRKEKTVWYCHQVLIISDMLSAMLPRSAARQSIGCPSQCSSGGRLMEVEG